MRDHYGNTLKNRPVKLLSSRSGDTITELGTQTNASGEQRFTVSTATVGSFTLRAIDLMSTAALSTELPINAGGPPSNVGGSPTAAPMYGQMPAGMPYYMPMPQYYPVPQYANPWAASMLPGSPYAAQATGDRGFDVLDHFIVQVPTEMTVNVHENMKITAVDSNGQVVEDYVGTVKITSTDGDADLPGLGEVTFRSSDLGSKPLTLGLKFSKPGAQTVYVTDSSNADIKGEAVTNVLSEKPNNSPATISVTSPANGATVTSSSVTVSGTGPAYINLTVTGGVTDATGETDGNGAFAIAVQLDPNKVEHLLTVKNADSPENSTQVTVKRLSDPPTVEKLTFNPSAPMVGQDVTAVAEIQIASERLASAELKAGETVYSLQPVENAVNTFQTVMNFPTDGPVTVTLTVKDTFGQEAVFQSSLTVSKPAIPKVKGLVAESKPNGISLRWDAVDADIDAYRIFIQPPEEGSDFFTLDTQKASTAATVGGLRPGTTYLFAVAAMREGELGEESDIVQSLVLGLNVEVTASDSSLGVRWVGLETLENITAYALEYALTPEGLAASEKPERMVLKSSEPSVTLRDLINGQTYHLRLTPLSADGQAMTELAVTTQGTPTGGTFTPGPNDEVPSELIGGHGAAPENTVPPPTPTPEALAQNGLGIPLWFLLAVAVAGVGMLGFTRKPRTTVARHIPIVAQHHEESEDEHPVLIQF